MDRLCAGFLLPRKKRQTRRNMTPTWQRAKKPPSNAARKAGRAPSRAPLTRRSTRRPPANPVCWNQCSPRQRRTTGSSRRSGPIQYLRRKWMAEKVKKLNLERDYKKYLYFIDGQGNVCQKPKSGDGESKVLVENAVDRDNQFLYFIDKEGDVSRSPRGAKRGPAKQSSNRERDSEAA